MRKIGFYRENEGLNGFTKIGDVPLDCASIVEKFIKELANDGGARSEPVIVVAIDEPVWAASLAGKKRKAMAINQTFPSAMHASVYLGYPYNAVAQALGKERRRAQESGKKGTQMPKAVLLGVAFQFVKDLTEI